MFPKPWRVHAMADPRRGSVTLALWLGWLATTNTVCLVLIAEGPLPGQTEQHLFSRSNPYEDGHVGYIVAGMSI